MLFALIGATVGLAAVAGIVKFACDELSEDEVAHQQELVHQFDENKRKTEQRLTEIEENKERPLNEIRQRFGELYNTERKQIEKEVSDEYKKNLELFVADKWKIRSKLVDSYLEAADERNSYIVSLRQDIQNAITVIKKQEKECKTVARKNALRHFLRELYETNEKSKAYGNYVKQYKTFIGKVTGRSDLAFVVPVLNRWKSDFSKAIGLFVNLMPVRIQIPKSSEIGDVLRKVVPVVREDLKNQFYQYNHFINHIREQNPAFYLYFSFEDASMKRMDGFEDYAVKGVSSKFDIDINICNYNDMFKIELAYKSNKYEFDLIERIMNEYVRLLNSITDGAIQE